MARMPSQLSPRPDASKLLAQQREADRLHSNLCEPWLSRWKMVNAPDQRGFYIGSTPILVDVKV